MILSELSRRNAKRQAKDYLVYFISIVLAAAMIYAFNALAFSEEIRSLSVMFETMPFFVGTASAVVVCIIGWLVHYTVSFMLAKRSRELGTYILLGMENEQVAALFFTENLIVGAAAIAAGTVLGNLLFQILRALTLALFDISYSFNFSFSFYALLLTLFYFALIYLFALLRSRRRIRRMKIYDLLYMEKKNENEAIKSGKDRRRLFVASIILGVIGTLLLISWNALTGTIGAGLIIIFLYGFFLSFSSGVPDYFEKRPEKKYKGTTVLIFRALSSKLSTMGVVMATISVLFTATLVAEGSGMLFQLIFQSRSEQVSFDLFIGSADEDEKHLDLYLQYINENIPVASSHRYNIYESGSTRINDYVGEYLNEQSEYAALSYDDDRLMAYSDYEILREMMGLAPTERLKEDEYIIHCQSWLKDVILEQSGDLELNGSKISFSGQIYSESFMQSIYGSGNGETYILVVPDEVLINQPISHRIYAAMTPAPVKEADYEKLMEIVMNGQDRGNYDAVYSKAEIIAENAASSAMIVYPLYYLALVLTMTAATILTIQLLSETGRYRRQYALLDSLGMDYKIMRKSLTRQFILFYSMPTLPPVLISAVYITALSSVLDAGIVNGVWHLLSIIGITLALFFGIYLIYVLSAYNSFKQNVLPEKR